MKGMANAYREMARYAKRRAEIPRLISSDERDRLLRETLEFPDEVGLTGDVVSDLDKMMETSRLSSGKLDPQFLMIEGPMKLFEKAEWINRMTTVHAVKHNYIRRGSDLLIQTETSVLSTKQPMRRSVMTHARQWCSSSLVQTFLVRQQCSFLEPRRSWALLLF